MGKIYSNLIWAEVNLSRYIGFPVGYGCMLA